MCDWVVSVDFECLLLYVCVSPAYYTGSDVTPVDRPDPELASGVFHPTVTESSMSRRYVTSVAVSLRSQYMHG